MSTDTAPRTTRGENEVATVVEAYFERLAKSGRQPRLRQYNGICQVDIAPLGSWYVRMKDGITHVTREPAGDTPARCVITCSAADLADIVTRKNHMNVMTALLQEKVAMTGDLAFGFALLSGFTFVPRERSRHVEE